MKRRMLSMALVLVMLLGMVSFPAYAEEGSSAGQAGPDGVTALNGGEPITPTQPDGAGTEASPYQIGTAAELF